MLNKMLTFVGLPGHMELVIIGIVAILIFGRQLPKIARNIGQSLVELRKGFKEYHDLENEFDGKDEKKHEES